MAQPRTTRSNAAGRKRTGAGRARSAEAEGNGWMGLLTAIGGALLLAVVGFGFGLVVGLISEEPQLVVGHLSGRSTEVAWDQAPPLASPRAAAKAGLEEGGAVAVPAVAAAKPLPDVSAPPPSRPTPVVRAAPTPADTAGFSVQVGAFTSEMAAQELLGLLRKRGYEVYLTPGDGFADGRWRVRVGPVPSRGAADQLAGRLEREEKLPTWVLGGEGA